MGGSTGLQHTHCSVTQDKGPKNTIRPFTHMHTRTHTHMAAQPESGYNGKEQGLEFLQDERVCGELFGLNKVNRQALQMGYALSLA